MEKILEYFKDLSTEQTAQFGALDALYHDWNSKINVISRKDIDNLYLHHVLHSLSIARFIRFKPGTEIVDIGTGGGFPGIPLAIMFPDSRFTLVDSIGKKVKVAENIASQIGLKNVTCIHAAAQELKDRFEFAVSRAVMQLPDLMKICNKLLDKKLSHNAYPAGLICLKGGDLTQEIALTPGGKNAVTELISNYFPDPWFAENSKQILYIPRQ